MKQTQSTLKKARDVLKNNKGYQEAVESYKEMAKTLTHWGDPETVEEIIFITEDGTIVMSNECSVDLSHPMYTSDLLYGLDEDFEKAGLYVEAYDGGTFHIYKDQ